jgi:hypothetical protein
MIRFQERLNSQECNILTSAQLLKCVILTFYQSKWSSRKLSHKSNINLKREQTLDLCSKLVNLSQEEVSFHGDHSEKMVLNQ